MSTAPRTVVLVLTLLSLVTASPAQAGWWTGLHRELGLGWSDGYHAQTGCAPCEPKRTQPRYRPPVSHYEVPSWLYGESIPAPEPSGPSPATPAAPASLHSGNRSIHR